MIVKVPVMNAGIVSWWYPTMGLYTRWRTQPPRDAIADKIERLYSRGTVTVEMYWMSTRKHEWWDGHITYTEWGEQPAWRVKLKRDRSRLSEFDWLMGRGFLTTEAVTLDAALDAMLARSRPEHVDLNDLVWEKQHADA